MRSVTLYSVARGVMAFLPPWILNFRKPSIVAIDQSELILEPFCPASLSHVHSFLPKHCLSTDLLMIICILTEYIYLINIK